VLVGLRHASSCNSRPRRSEPTTPQRRCNALQEELTESAEIPVRRKCNGGSARCSSPAVTVGGWTGAPKGRRRPSSFGEHRPAATRPSKVDGPVPSGRVRNLPEPMPPCAAEQGPGPRPCMLQRIFSADAGREAITQLLLIAMADDSSWTSCPARLVMGGLRPAAAWQSVAAISAMASGRQRCRSKPQHRELLNRSPSAFDDLLDRRGYLLRRARISVDGSPMSCVHRCADQWLRSGCSARPEQTSSTRGSAIRQRRGQRWGCCGNDRARWALIQGEAERVGAAGERPCSAIARDEAAT